MMHYDVYWIDKDDVVRCTVAYGESPEDAARIVWEEERISFDRHRRTIRIEPTNWDL